MVSGRFSLEGILYGICVDLNIGLNRATASFKDANLLGIYLSGSAPLIWGVAYFLAKGKTRIILFIISLLTFIGIILTYSRPTLLAAYGAILFSGLLRKIN